MVDNIRSVFYEVPVLFLTFLQRQLSALSLSDIDQERAHSDNVQGLVAYVPFMNLQNQPFTIGANVVSFEVQQFPLPGQLSADSFAATASLLGSYEIPNRTAENLIRWQAEKLTFGKIDKDDLPRDVDLVACDWRLCEELV